MKDPNNNEDELISELEEIGRALDSEIEIANATEQSFVEFKQDEFLPIYDEYYGSRVVGKFEFIDFEKKSASGKKLKDPKGGLTAAGRAHFKRTEGANLKPGVKGPADTPEKMRRKGSFLTRFFSNPSGPMKDEKGRATRLALSAAAWGEPVPQDASDAARLAAKGRRLLERYANTKKKKDAIEDGIETKKLGPTIGEQAGGKPAPGSNPDEAIDHDMDGMIFDGTPQEQRKPYKKGKDSLGREQGMDYEKRRRAYVRQELARQGIKRNKNKNRTEAERLARTRARARFDDMEFQKERRDSEGRTGPGGGPDSFDRAERERQERMRPKSPIQGKPADRYPSPSKKYPPGQKPSARDVKPADRADRSAPNRRPDSADRASRSEYKPGYILEDADGQLQQYDGQPPKDKPYIREQRDGQLQQFGPPRRRGSGKRDF